MIFSSSPFICYLLFKNVHLHHKNITTNPQQSVSLTREKSNNKCGAQFKKFPVDLRKYENEYTPFLKIILCFKYVSVLNG